FSSRRRHTSCYRDWSSDVCSSDLRSVSALRSIWPAVTSKSSAFKTRALGAADVVEIAVNKRRRAASRIALPYPFAGGMFGVNSEIGRASCRERVEVTDHVGDKQEG